jgi:hypothetical protein
MTKRSTFLGAALLAVAFPAVAEARIVDLRLSGQGGGMVGWGTTTNTPDFFEQARGPGFGFEIGAKLLVFDFSVTLLQMIGGEDAH